MERAPRALLLIALQLNWGVRHRPSPQSIAIVVNTLLVATTAMLAFTSAASAHTMPCDRPGARCVCAGPAEPAELVRYFARGGLERTYASDGAFVEATLLHVRDVDAFGRPVADTLHGPRSRLAYEFAVVRAWSRPGGVSPVDTVRFYASAITMCPRPDWEAGKRYLLFTYRDRDTLRTWFDCQKENSSELPATRRALQMLDSLLVRH